MRYTLSLCLTVSLGLFACGDSDVELADDGGGAGDGDGGGATVDGAPPAGGTCDPIAGTQCNNCMDDDGDGFVDGEDPECTGAADQREDSFATGIPGDNMDDKPDCFFDGDSGAGNDECDFHYCCIAPAVCEDENHKYYDPDFNTETDCPMQNNICTETCEAVTPPGCDCAGCCTVCDPNNPADCGNIAIDPNLYPDYCNPDGNKYNPDHADFDTTCCNQDLLENCYECAQNDECGSEPCNDDVNDCILCPGQTEDDLPDGCNMQNECSSCFTGNPQDCVCDTSADCEDLGANFYCSVGCCISGGID